MGDEPAVAAARADHLASKGIAYAAAAPAIAGLGYAGYAPGYAAGYGYSGPLNLNNQLIAHPNGAVVPVDDPAVANAPAPTAYAPTYGYSGPLNLNNQLIAHPN